MQPRDYHAAARRWAKYPAAILFALGVVWLLNNYFELDWASIGEQTETIFPRPGYGGGIAIVFANLLLIPLGSMIIGVCVMFLQRWALWGAGIIATIPLAVKSADIIVRIDDKFAAYRATGSSSEYGGAIMWALALLAAWTLYGIMIYHLRKALYWHARARQWVKRPSGSHPAQTATRSAVQNGDKGPEEEQEICYIMPDTELDTGD